MELNLDTRKLVKAAFLVAVALLVMHVIETALTHVAGHGRLIGLVGTFNMNYENNVPTFFAGLLLASCALVLAVVARMPAQPPENRPYWRWLAVIFFLLALDEQASLHEMWTVWIHHFVPMEGVLYFAWVIPYGIGALVVGLLYLRFVLRLPKRTSRLCILAGMLYLGGAIGTEMVGGWYLSGNDEEEDFLYMLMVGTEEFLEMSGAIVLLHLLFDYLKGGLAGDPLRVQLR